MAMGFNQAGYKDKVKGKITYICHRTTNCKWGHLLQYLSLNAPPSTWTGLLTLPQRPPATRRVYC